MNKTEEILRKIHTANYLYQTDEINHDELEVKLLTIIDEYAQQVSREKATQFCAWFESTSHKHKGRTWIDIYDEWQQKQEESNG